jgi:hypothetical protein
MLDLGEKLSDADKRHLRTPFGRVSRRLRGGVCGELLLRERLALP